jgi:hypothetical protein
LAAECGRELIPTTFKFFLSTQISNEPELNCLNSPIQYGDQTQKIFMGGRIHALQIVEVNRDPDATIDHPTHTRVACTTVMTRDWLVI